jgi:hypothetical protein
VLAHPPAQLHRRDLLEHVRGVVGLAELVERRAVARKLQAYSGVLSGYSAGAVARKLQAYSGVLSRYSAGAVAWKRWASMWVCIDRNGCDRKTHKHTHRHKHTHTDTHTQTRTHTHRVCVPAWKYICVRRGGAWMRFKGNRALIGCGDLPHSHACV